MVVRPLNTGYRGMIYPVNPNSREIAGIRFLPFDLLPSVRISIWPSSPFPQPWCRKPCEECIRHGIRGAVVISAGFAEANPEGEKLQQEVARLAKDRRHPPGRTQLHGALELPGQFELGL